MSVSWRCCEIACFPKWRQKLLGLSQSRSHSRERRRVRSWRSSPTWVIFHPIESASSSEPYDFLLQLLTLNSLSTISSPSWPGTCVDQGRHIVALFSRPLAGFPCWDKVRNAGTTGIATQCARHECLKGLFCGCLLSVVILTSIVVSRPKNCAAFSYIVTP